MHKRSDAVLVIVAGCVCAGLIWASQTLADFVRRPSITQASVAVGAASKARLWEDVMASARTRAGATSSARPSSRAGVAPPSMLAMSLEQPSYSMSPPEFFSDPAAAAARSIAVGDVSGDGRDDLVFLSQRWATLPTDNRMELYAAYQRVDGRFDAAVKITEWSDDILTDQLLIADLDRNGVGDIITAPGNTIMVLHSNADGTFRSSTAVAGDPYDIVVTDVDRDGYLDVLVDSSNTSATVIHGSGRGVIERTSTLPLPSAAVRTTGDVTGDGLDDLILGTIFNRPLEEYRIYPALASGGYAAPVVRSLPLGSNHTAALAVGDFNADGRGDLALDEAKDAANLHLYFQDAQGNLGSSFDIARQRGASTGSLVATDLNRDGRTDLSIAHSGWGYIGYYLQTETGLMSETVINAYSYMGRVYYFATGDLNHDGCGDLVIARSSSQSPVLLYGQGCASRPRIADCRMPAVPMEGSGVVAASLVSPLAPQGNRDVGANGRAVPDTGHGHAPWTQQTALRRPQPRR